MNTKKIILSTVIALSSVAAISAFSFADEMNSDQMPERPQMQRTWERPQFGSGERPQFSQENRPEFGSWQRPEMNWKMWNRKWDPMLNDLKPLISTWLSDTDKQSLDSIIENYKTNTKSIMDSYSGSTVTSWTKEEIFNKMKQLKVDLLNSVQSYISTDKSSDYTKLVEKVSNSNFTDQRPMWDNNQKPEDNSKKANNNNTFHSDKPTNSSQFKYIKWNTYNVVKNKLDSLSTETLDNLLNKLDTIISQTTNEKSLWVYNELRIMISDKLGNSYDESANIIDSLLN